METGNRNLLIDNYNLESAFIHLTNSCNLKCAHCAYSSGKPYKNELLYDDIEKLVIYLKSKGGVRIMIGGGEPLLRRDIGQILNLLSDNDFEIKLETNLTINNKIISMLSQYSRLTVITSLDSMKPEAHDRLRGSRSSFTKVHSNIVSLRKEGVPIVVNALMLKTNADDVERYLEFSSMTGAVYRPLFRVLHMGRAAGANTLIKALNANEIADILTKLFRYSLLYDRNSIMFYLPPVLLPAPLIASPYTCRWGYFLGILADGGIAICPAAGNIADFRATQKESLGSLINGTIEFEELSFVRRAYSFNPNRLRGVCRTCIMRRVCRGGCRVDAYAHYANYYAPDPLCESFFRTGLFPEYGIGQADR